MWKRTPNTQRVCRIFFSLLFSFLYSPLLHFFSNLIVAATANSNGSLKNPNLKNRSFPFPYMECVSTRMGKIYHFLSFSVLFCLALFAGAVCGVYSKAEYMKPQHSVWSSRGEPKETKKYKGDCGEESAKERDTQICL